MKDKIAAVHQFHSAFGLGIENHPTAALGGAKNLLRYKLRREENEDDDVLFGWSHKVASYIYIWNSTGNGQCIARVLIQQNK